LVQQEGESILEPRPSDTQINVDSGQLKQMLGPNMAEQDYNNDATMAEVEEEEDRDIDLEDLTKKNPST